MGALVAKAIPNGRPNIVRIADEALGFHEALRRLGFLAADIFVQVAQTPDGVLGAFVMLRVHGAPEAVFGCGTFESQTEAQAFEAEWRRTIIAWNETMPESMQREIYDRSFVRNHAYAFVQVLAVKGLLTDLGGVGTIDRWFNA